MGRPVGGLLRARNQSVALMTEPLARNMLHTCGKELIQNVKQEERPPVADKTQKTRVKRASKGYRKFVRQQKQAARKVIAPRN
jgi:hypothetical protein